MKEILIATSNPYRVIVGEQLLKQIGSHMEQICDAEKVAIISDETVWPLYGGAVTESLRQKKFNVFSYTFPAGEQRKNLETYGEILHFLSENHFSRSDAIIALGGGVVGDIAGFAAATYLRGITLIQVPTSLLAMVDASVGGKTALNLPAGKNLAGAFFQPRLVLCDLETLRTLPEMLFCDGCAEIIKYSILYDMHLFNHLHDFGVNFDREYVISRCIQLKAAVVSRDEFDLGERQKLNLGHTVGHALEILSDYQLTHGQAVAVGIATVMRSAYKHNYCTGEITEKMIGLLQKFSLPIHTDYTSNDICTAALADKKRFTSIINLIVPVSIGNCIIKALPVAQLESFIKAGL